MTYRLVLAISFCALWIASSAFAGPGSRGDSWPLGGYGLGNQRSNPHVDLHPRQLRDIEVAWSHDLEGDAWTQPTVAYGKVFVTDNAGYIYAFDAVDGTTLWKRPLADLWNDPAAPDLPKPIFAASRTAPAVRYSDYHGAPVLYIGDQAGNPTLADTPKDGANIYAINANTGELLALTKVANPAEAPGEDFTVLTGAMTLYNDKLYTGVSGLAEANPDCIAGNCTFRGRVLCYDADTLELEWETYTVPELPFAGGSVWASTPAVDPKRNQLLVGTGDNYQIPEDIQACVVEAKMRFGTLPNAENHPDAKPAIRACVEADPRWADNHFDSVLALDLDTGEINWALRTLLYDTWNLGCLSAADWPTECGPDMDFSQHPMLVSLGDDDDGLDIVVVGQKNGSMFALDPADGSILWQTTENRAGSRFEPGLTGGFQMGSSFNGRSVIGLAGNSYGIEHTLRGRGGRRTTVGGTIVGFNPRNGRVRWETPAPADTAFATGLLNDVVQILFGRTIGGDDPPATFGAPSCAGRRICFWGSMGAEGYLFATDTLTGKTVWTQPANGSVFWAGAIVDLGKRGIFYYVGSGYSSFSTGVAARPGANFWAYWIPQKK